MTKEEYFKHHAEFCERMQAITKAKNSDYTGASSDPFANFQRVEGLGICSTEVGFLTRMTDKLCRISSFVAKGSLEVQDESVLDTLLDLANYSALMAGYLKAKRGGKNEIENARPTKKRNRKPGRASVSTTGKRHAKKKVRVIPK